VNQTNFQYMHYRSANGTKGGATVAILPDATTKTALFAISRCGPQDIFNKKIGRAVASGRINAFVKGRAAVTEHINQVAYDDELDLKSLVDAVVGGEMDAYGLE